MTTATTPTTTDVLADIERRLIALGDQGDALNTANAQAKWAADQSRLVNWRQAIHTSVSTLAQVEPKIAADEKWEADLTKWREQLNTDLDAEPPRIRNQELAVQQNLKTSIKVIDLGKRCDGEWTTQIEMLPLGALMRASGYVQAPPEVNTNQMFGPLPFYGSLSDVRGRLKDLRAERDAAQRALDSAMREATS